MGYRIIGRARAIALRVRAALSGHAHANLLRVRAALSGHAHANLLRARAALSGHAHANLLRARAALSGHAGQGTVEYVALILLVAGLFATVVVAAGGVKGDGIAHVITEKIKTTIDGVGAKKG